MSKKLIIFVIIAAVATGGIGLIIRSRTSDTPPQSGSSTTQEKIEVKGEETYKDASGFSFAYPKDAKVSDVTPSEESYYSVVELTSEGGKLTITIRDATASTIDGWVKEESTSRSLDTVGATSLDGVSAKQLAGSQTLLTVAIDQGVEYIIEGPKDNTYWEELHNLIVSSFAFGDTPRTTTSTGGENVTYEPEEEIY